MNYLSRILLISVLFSTATPSFGYDIKLDSKTMAYTGAAAVAIGGISYAIYQTGKTDLNNDLFNAIQHNNVAKVKALLQKGASANAICNDYLRPNWTVLIMAAAHGYTDIVRELLAHGAHVNVKTTFGNGNPALILAARFGYLDIVELLLAHGADIESMGHDQATPLIDAAYYGRFNVVETLLRRDANINAQDEKGKTALIYAITYGHYSVAKMLLEHGADVHITDKSGKTALSYTFNFFNYYYQNEFIVLLKAHGATE